MNNIQPTFNILIVVSLMLITLQNVYVLLRGEIKGILL